MNTYAFKQSCVNDSHNEPVWVRLAAGNLGRVSCPGRVGGRSIGIHITCRGNGALAMELVCGRTVHMLHRWLAQYDTSCAIETIHDRGAIELQSRALSLVWSTGVWSTLAMTNISAPHAGSLCSPTARTNTSRRGGPRLLRGARFLKSGVVPALGAWKCHHCHTQSER